MVDSLNDQPSERAVSEHAISQDHIALIYENAEERLAATIPLVKVGLERGELCLYISDSEDDQDIVEALKAEHIDVEKSISNGGLILTSKQEIYFQTGRFDPDWTLRVIKNVADLAISYGFTAMRVISDMTWTQDNVPGVERWPEYESKLCTLDLGLRLRAICQYDRSALSPESLLYAVRTHTKLVCDGAVYDNIFFVSPERLQAGEAAVAELEGMLDSIIAVSSAETELQSNERRLQDLLEKLDRETHSKAAAETSLDESRARFNALCERSSEWVWETGPDGTYTYSSPRVNDFLGMAKEEVIGRRPEELVVQEDAERVSLSIAKARSDRSSISALEKMVRHRDGHIVHLEMNGVPIVDRDGTFRGYRGMDKDISGRKASKKAIDEHRHRIEEMTAVLAARDSRICALEEEIGQLRGSISAKENAAAALTAALGEKEQEAGKLAGEIEKLSAGLSSLNAQLQHASDASALDRKELERRDAHIELIKYNMANLENDLAAEREHAHSIDVESQNALAAMRNELAVREEEIKAATASLAALGSEAESLKARLDTALADVAEIRQEMDSLRASEAAKVEELNKRGNELSAAASRTEQLVAEAESLRASLADKEAQLRSRSAELEAATMALADLDAVRREIEALKASGEAKEQELSKRGEELSAVSALVQQLTAESEALRASLAEKEAELSFKDEELGSCRSREEDVKALLTSRDMEVGMLKRRAEASAAEIARQTEELCARDEELTTMRVQLAAGQADSLALRNEMAGKEAALATAERELNGHREQLRALLRQDRVGVAHIDMDGRVVGANSAFHCLLGQEPGGLAGRHYRDLTFRDDLAESAEMYRRLQEGESFVSSVKRYVRKHGGIVTASLTLSTVNGPNGAPAYYVAMAYDRTEEALDVDAAAVPQNADIVTRDPAMAQRLNDILTVISGSVTLAKEYVIPEGRMFNQLIQMERAAREAAMLAAELGGATAVVAAFGSQAASGPAKLVPGRGKIILVDSDEAVLEATTEMLRHLGYDVDVARDSEEAAAICRHASEAGAPFALAIIDVECGSEGAAVAASLASENPGLRMMASSGHAAHAAMADPKSFGFSAALPRPYTLEELSQAVGSVLSHAQQGKA